MILADANIWIGFFRGQRPELGRLMKENQIVMHAYVAAELALGSLRDRATTLRQLDSMQQLRVIALADIRRMIEGRRLYSRGIGLTDTHLLASCLAAPGTMLWTADARLSAVAHELAVRASVGS